MGTNLIHLGNCLEVLKTLPDNSINTCVTSPPYWGLRDYGMPDQLGQEKTPEEFVQNMVQVFREVKRVLREDGTLWLNLGDSYLPNKQLAGIPWRVAFALQTDGWVLRSEIIWHKPNPMPESVTDRPTKSHEQIFLLSKSSSYYYDAKAIREPLAKSSHQRLAQDIANQKGSDRVPGKTNGTMKAVGKGLTFGGKKGREYTPTPDDPNFRNGSEQWGREYTPAEDGKANKKTVWSVATKPYKEAHFATYPPELITDCIKAGCPVGGIVLDPFFGSGTTGEVAERLDRKWIGIELNPEYKALAEKRTGNVFPLFKPQNAA